MAPNQKLSPHFLLSEAIVTNTGIDNYPDSDEDLATLGRTAQKMEEVRALLGSKPITVNSWYRNKAVNTKVGGVPNSQHQLGEAVDFVCPAFGSITAIVNHLKAHKDILNYDQLILEPTWVHISFNTSRKHRNKAPRKQFINLKG